MTEPSAPPSSPSFTSNSSDPAHPNPKITFDRTYMPLLPTNLEFKTHYLRGLNKSKYIQCANVTRSRFDAIVSAYAF